RRTQLGDSADLAVVHETPEPALPGLGRADDGMRGSARMAAGVAILRVVAATYAAAMHAHAQVYPRVTSRHARVTTRMHGKVAPHQRHVIARLHVHDAFVALHSTPGCSGPAWQSQPASARHGPPRRGHSC